MRLYGVLIQCSKLLHRIMFKLSDPLASQTDHFADFLVRPLRAFIAIQAEPQFHDLPLPGGQFRRRPIAEPLFLSCEL